MCMFTAQHERPDHICEHNADCNDESVSSRTMRCDTGMLCRRTEKSMERVLGLNQSLVDSFTRQQPTPDPSTEAVTCTAVLTSPSKLRSGQCCPA